MKKTIKKSLPLFMMALMFFTSVMPTFATVNEKQTVNTNSNAQTEVFYNQESQFEVIVPKLIDLGIDKTTNYTVTVSGDISSDNTVIVVPEESFLMKDISGGDKADVIATVIQDKTQWTFNEFETIGNGNVSAPDLTAGKWEGKFYFNISMSNTEIGVEAKDSEGNNLNASATNITGEQKDNLLSGLVESGFVETTDDVDALISVESDDFDGIAETTFDVSNIAKEGDTIVILHFDEEKQQWEYIGTETVDSEGKIMGDFTSYSPVAFVKVESNGTLSHVHNYIESITAPTCTEQGYTTYNCAGCNDSYKDNYVDATDHTWDSDYTIDVAATHSTAGSKSIHCSNCSEIKNITTIRATGHTASCYPSGATKHVHEGSQTSYSGCYKGAKTDSYYCTGTLSYSHTEGDHCSVHNTHVLVNWYKCNTCGGRLGEPECGCNPIQSSTHDQQVTIYARSCGKTAGKYYYSNGTEASPICGQ